MRSLALRQHLLKYPVRPLSWKDWELRGFACSFGMSPENIVMASTHTAIKNCFFVSRMYEEAYLGFHLVKLPYHNKAFSHQRRYLDDIRYKTVKRA